MWDFVYKNTYCRTDNAICKREKQQTKQKIALKTQNLTKVKKHIRIYVFTQKRKFCIIEL